MDGGLLQFLIVCIIVGAGLYLLQLVPIDGTIKRIIQVIAIVLICIWALRILAPSLPSLSL